MNLKIKNLIIYTFPFAINFIMLIQMIFYKINIRAGIISSLIVLILFFLNIKYIKFFFDYTNYLFSLFLLINLFTGLNYIFFNKYNNILFFYGINYNFIPMVSYFFGGLIALQQNKRSNFLLIFSITLSNFIIILLGIIFYFFEFDFYNSYLVNYFPVSFLQDKRLVSYIGTSMVIGNISAFSIPLVYYLKYYSNKIYYSFWIVIFILGSFLSGSRSSMISASIILIVSKIYYDYYRKKKIKMFLSYCIIIVFIFLGFFILINIKDDFFIIKQIFIRINRIPFAISERSGQWLNSVDTISDNIFGSGVGSLGHKAVRFHNNTIPDGNYFRILGEIGILGFMVFLFLQIISLIISYKNNFFLFNVLLVYYFQAIGTNVFDLYYSAQIFWLLLGFIINLNRINYDNSKFIGQ